MDTEFTGIPEEVRGLVVRQAAYEQFLDDDASVTLNKTVGNLELVCTEWQSIIHKEIKVGTPSWKAWNRVFSHEEIYQQFLNGVLIYRPYQESDKGMIQLKISDLPNPLERTFDLSGCGDRREYLSISTGYRKGMKAENKGKIEIWLTPRFVATSASHLAPIMDTWEQQIGIVMNNGGWKDFSRYDYITNRSAREISSENLLKNLSHARHTQLRKWYAQGKYFICVQSFTFICEPK